MNVSLNQVRTVVGYTSLDQAQQKTDQKNMSEAIKQMASKIVAKVLTNSYYMQYNSQISMQASSNFGAQSSLFGLSNANSSKKLAEILSGIDLNAIGYTGRYLTELSQSEAGELVGENGFFGIGKTAERIASFVISGAGNDLERLKAGKEGMMRGFKDAERIWGGELPKISQKTMQKALETVDKKIAQLGGNALNVTA